MIEKEFVSYEIASQLKEIGFDEECMGWYNPDLMVAAKNIKQQDLHWEYYLAPLWQQVIDWFREEYGLEIAITSWENNIIPGRSESISYILYSGANFKYNIYKYNPWHIFDSKYIFNTYHKAREQAILKAIEEYRNLKI
jgi:hypothetical protein